MLQLPLKNNNISSYFAADVINNNGYFKINQDFKTNEYFFKTTILY